MQKRQCISVRDGALSTASSPPISPYPSLIAIPVPASGRTEALTPKGTLSVGSYLFVPARLPRHENLSSSVFLSLWSFFHVIDVQ